MTVFDDLVSALTGPFRLFADPSKRVYWPFLLGTIAITLLVGAASRRWTQDGPGWRRTLADLLSPSVWWHRSARLDYKLLFANAVFKTLAIVPWALTAFGLAVAIVGLLDGHLGRPDPIGWSNLQVAVLYTAVLFLAWDLSRYVLHRFLHRVPALWELHKVHHSAEVLTPLTLYRTHPLESLLYTLRGILVTGVITGVFFYFFRQRAVQYQLVGVNAVGFLFNLLGGNLRHSHVWLSYGRRLEHLLISPAQHQIHHSLAREHHDRNFGTWLALWDWLGGTLFITGRRRSLRFGLDQASLNHNPHRLFSALWRPLSAGMRALRGRWSPRTSRKPKSTTVVPIRRRQGVDKSFSDPSASLGR